MLPGSYDYLIILLLGLILVTITKNKYIKAIILTLLSGAYLTSFGVNESLVFLLIALITLIFSQLSKFSPNLFRAFGIIFNILVLAAFGLRNYLPPGVILSEHFPIGLSFLVFKNISYLVDSSKTKSNILDYLLYVLFFPFVSSGPLTKFSEFIKIFWQKANISKYEIQVGFTKILVGLTKKLVFATYLSDHLVNSVFQLPENKHPILLIFALYGFALQIYMDFSGYSDIVIGSARLLGIKVPENFNAPYLADSIKDFWKRWHISLSNWLTTYIYIPLGGNKLGKFREIINTGIVFLLSSLWHGISYNFLIWGGIHFIFISIDKLNLKVMLPKWIRIFTTFHIILVSWLFFNTSSIASALSYLSRIFNFTTSNYLSPFVIDLNVILLILLGFIFHNYSEKIVESVAINTYKFRPIFNGLLFGIFLAIIYLIGPDTVPNFIYYNF